MYMKSFTLELGLTVQIRRKAVSIKHGLQTTDCRLGIKYELGIKCGQV